jgi:uncharacterized repeat protein (TIGR01451 family)
MKLICIVLLLILCLNVACAYSEDDLEWACGSTKKLFIDDTISNGNFTIMVCDFSKSADQKERKFVGITIYEMGIQVADLALVESEDYIYNDTIRITVTELSIPETDWATGLPEESWVKIKLEPRGVPCFDVDFETDKDDYPAYSSKIEMDLTIQNTGDAKADDVDIHIDTGGLELINGQDHYHYSNIEKGVRIDHETDTAQFDPIPLQFAVPSVIVDTEFNVKVDIECTDITGIKYSYSITHPVKVSGCFRISKSINDNIYINEVAIVTISLTNDGSRPINAITVSDTLPDNFKLKENSSLEWEMDLSPGESRSITYTLLPIQPDEEGYVTPPASAQWTGDGKIYTAHTDTPNIDVYGPKIELLKSVNPGVIDGEATVTVTIEVKNTGNVLANVVVTDSLPENAKLEDGKPEAEIVLRGGESQTFSYKMKLDISDSIELPCAVAHFVDIRDCSGNVVSDIISIKTDQKEETNAKQTSSSQHEKIIEQTAGNNTDSEYENATIGWICIVVGFFLAVMVIKRYGNLI